MFTQTIHMVKQSLNLINNLIDNVMMFVFVIMCVSVGCLLPDFQYVKISIGALSTHHNVASFLRCRRKSKGILHNGVFNLEVSSKTMDTFLVPFTIHSEIVHTVVNLIVCMLQSILVLNCLICSTTTLIHLIPSFQDSKGEHHSSNLEGVNSQEQTGLLQNFRLENLLTMSINNRSLCSSLDCFPTRSQ